MAKCTFDPMTGKIITISGKVGSTIYKTYRNGQVRAYLVRPDQFKRTTPPTPAELRKRQLFAIVASEVARRRREGDTRSRKVIWAEVRTEAERMQAGIGSEAIRGCL